VCSIEVRELWLLGMLVPLADQNHKRPLRMSTKQARRPNFMSGPLLLPIVRDKNYGLVESSSPVVFALGGS